MFVDGPEMQMKSAKIPTRPKVAGGIIDQGKSDFENLAALADQWLMTPEIPCVDITPTEGDGSVDWQDLLIFAENWLESM